MNDRNSGNIFRMEIRSTSPTPLLKKDEFAIEIRNLTAHYGGPDIIKDINLKFLKNHITALIGPSGCGKSTLLRCLNRLHEIAPGAKQTGDIIIEGENNSLSDPVALRQKVGMVFQKPNPFPTMSIYQNVVAGLMLNGNRDKSFLLGKAEESLTQAALWDEVKDKLHAPALALSGGQQQRLCIARALTVKPKIMLLDEPCSALDPISTGHIEELLLELKESLTIIIVTHNMQQAARTSDQTIFMLLGEMVEIGETGQIFTNPKDSKTQDYITGRFG